MTHLILSTLGRSPFKIYPFGLESIYKYLSSTFLFIYRVVYFPNSKKTITRHAFEQNTVRLFFFFQKKQKVHNKQKTTRKVTHTAQYCILPLRVL